MSIRKLLLILIVTGLSSVTFAHEGGDFGSVRCSQNLEYTQDNQNGLGHFGVTLTQIDKSRDYILDVFLENQRGKKQHLFMDLVKVTTHDVLAIFESDKATVRIYLDELDQSSLHFNDESIYLICETNIREEE